MRTGDEMIIFGVIIIVIGFVFRRSLPKYDILAKIIIVAGVVLISFCICMLHFAQSH